jgi:hypothetical protein
VCNHPSRNTAVAGAVELELCKRLKAIADADKTLDQYGIRRFAEAFDVVPRTLAENSGEWLLSCLVRVCWWLFQLVWTAHSLFQRGGSRHCS